MATFLRPLSYRYQWLYDSISRISALMVGGEARFRQLALRDISLQPDMQILDLCCGSGQTTQFLVQRFPANEADPRSHITGLDASPKSIQRAQQNVPQATFVEGWAERMPFADQQFDVVHTSVAMHEMQPDQLRQILAEAYRVLKPNGVFTMIDFHQPTNLLLMPGLALFFWLFETETAWQLIRSDLAELLTQAGFHSVQRSLHAGGSLQVIHAHRA